MSLTSASREPSGLAIQDEGGGERPRRVLVVDDEEVLRETIGRILALEEYEVETAGNGAEALKVMECASFDLVIVDYSMPMMKGDALASAIKALYPGQPILMVTAYGESLRLSGTFPLEVDRVVSKPFALEDFRRAVRELAGRGFGGSAGL